MSKNRVLASKDASNFRSALKLYETKQYKKALKTIDGVLKKNANHGESLALKGLLLAHLGKSEEGHENIRKGIENDPTSHVCWHIYGLFYRQDKQYEEAAKCYAKSVSIDPENLNVIRDLSILQMQTQQYKTLVPLRRKLLADKPGFRQSWTSLAIAQHVNGDCKGAEETLRNFETLLKEPLPKSDGENSELMLYRNRIIYESGDVERALKDVEEIQDKVLDVLSAAEYKAQYLLELGRFKEAEREYRMLVKRNPECNAYYEALERALQIDKSSVKVRKLLYERLQAKYPKADLPKSIPLQFLTGEDFKVAVAKYVGGYLDKGVPSTFVMVKSFYRDAEKRKAIEEFILKKYETVKNAQGGANGHTTHANGSTTNSSTAVAEAAETNSTTVWTLYFLAQHYSETGQFAKSLELIDQCIEQSKELEFYLTKAKILKHTGDVVRASEVMEQARAMDTSDRFVNTKAGKYFFRANAMDEAIKTVSMFTRNDKTGNGLKDLHDMQGIFILIEQAEAYHRMENYGLALKRYLAVIKIINEFKTDQFDFHFYCPRKGTIRAYLEMIDWGNHLYEHPIYQRAVAGATEIYIWLDKRRQQIQDPDQEFILEYGLSEKLAGLDDEERKKAIKKFKKERAKELKKEHEEREHALANSSSGGGSAGQENVDTDVFGKQLLKTTTPLQDAFDIWKPLSELRVYRTAEPWKIGFEIYLAQQKHVLALQAVAKAKALGTSKSWIRGSAVRAKWAVDHADAETVPAAVKSVQKMMLPKVVGEDGGDIVNIPPIEYCDKYVLDETDAESVFEWAKARWDMAQGEAGGADRQAIIKRMSETAKTSSNLKCTEAMYWFVKRRGQIKEVEGFRADAKGKWPHGTVFNL